MNRANAGCSLAVRDKPDAVALLLAAEPELDIFDAASVGRTGVSRMAGSIPVVDARSSDGLSPSGSRRSSRQTETVNCCWRPRRRQGPAALAHKRPLDGLQLLREQTR